EPAADAAGLRTAAVDQPTEPGVALTRKIHVDGASHGPRGATVAGIEVEPRFDEHRNASVRQLRGRLAIERDALDAGITHAHSVFLFAEELGAPSARDREHRTHRARGDDTRSRHRRNASSSGVSVRNQTTLYSRVTKSDKITSAFGVRSVSSLVFATF